LRGLEFSQTRQHVSQAPVGRVFILRDNRTSAGLVEGAVINKKLTKAERLVQEQMLAMLECASDHPDKWHKIGNLEATKRAAELLEKRGVIEIWAGNSALQAQAAKVDDRGRYSNGSAVRLDSGTLVPTSKKRKRRRKAKR
jgi:hypothetical protein